MSGASGPSQSSLLPFLPTVAQMLAFTVRTRAYRGFRDWNLTYERVFEYGMALSVIEREKAARVLDVAGDISILGCFVAETKGAAVDIVDLGDLEYCRTLRERLPTARDRVALLPHRRAEELSPSQPYDVITCISAIEHFERGADIAFLERVAQLLAPGGVLLITAPFTPGNRIIERYRAHTYYDVHGAEQADQGFYMRYYDQDGIRELADSSGLHVERLLFAGEVVNFYDRVFLYGPIDDGSRVDRLRAGVSRIVGTLSPVYPFLFMRMSHSPHSYRVGDRRRRIYNPDTFALVLRRPA